MAEGAWGQDLGELKLTQLLYEIRGVRIGLFFSSSFFRL